MCGAVHCGALLRRSSVAAPRQHHARFFWGSSDVGGYLNEASHLEAGT